MVQPNKSAQSNLARGPRRGAVAHMRPIGPCGQWRAPNSPPEHVAYQILLESASFIRRSKLYDKNILVCF